MPEKTQSALNIMYGAEKIAAYLGIGKRQVYHACTTGTLPVFRIGATICARPDTLLAWIVEQEGKAVVPDSTVQRDAF